MKELNYLFTSLFFIFIMTSASLASPDKNKSFRIPEQISIYKIDGKYFNKEKIKYIVDKINDTGVFNESYLPNHSVFYNDEFIISEKRKLVLAKCVGDDGKVFLDRKIIESEANKFLNEKVKKYRACNSFSILSKGEHYNNNYSVYDVAFIGNMRQYPNDNVNDTLFRNNILFIKTVSLTNFSINTQNNVLRADFATGYDSGYIILRKFYTKDLNNMSSEKYYKDDNNNLYNKSMGIKK